MKVWVRYFKEKAILISGEHLKRIEEIKVKTPQEFLARLERMENVL